jgi:hypothetical protein
MRAAVIPAAPLFLSLFAAVPVAVLPLLFNNSGIADKLLIMLEEIGQKIQHNSDENKKCR